MYVFPSASEDIGLNLNSNVNGVALSHYALLDIPALPSYNYSTSGMSADTPEGIANAIALSLQNYMMNFETLLINDANYNYADLNTVSERVFWHWAKKVGIISTKNLAQVNGYDNIYYDKRHNADNDVAKEDNTVVKCFGAIDAGNSLSTDFGMFNETYVNIPTSYGAGPVFFKSSYTNNYRQKSYQSPTNGGTLEGREFDSQYTSYLGDETPMYDSGKSYNTGNSGVDGLELVKDLDTLQKILRRHYSAKETLAEKDTDGNILITSYDDINVDIKEQFGVDTEFNFNAILLYYSIYNQDDAIKTPQATNLFGIIFLDSPRQMQEIENGMNAFKIPPFRKVKSTTNRFGNSYSFRVNIKTLSVYDNTDAVIQDNTTMSSINSIDFSDVIYQLNRAIDIMNTNINATQKMQDTYASIVTYYNNQKDDIDDISNLLHAYLNGSHTSFLDTSLFYVNTIKVNPLNTSNNLTFYVIDSSENPEDIYYGNPKLTIDSSGVRAENGYIDYVYAKKQYIYEADTTSSDLNVLGNLTMGDISTANQMLDLIFNSSNNLTVNIKSDSDYSIDNTVYHNKVYNQMYISSRSAIFQRSDGDARNINHLITKDGGINYIAMIPMLVAEIQRMNIDISTYRNKVNTMQAEMEKMAADLYALKNPNGEPAQIELD